MPFYFQAVEAVTATKSGIRFIALALPEIVAIVVSGAVVSKIGYYVSMTQVLKSKIVSLPDTRCLRYHSWFSAFS